MPIGIAAATLIAGAAAGGATAYGAHAAGKSARHAADIQAQNDNSTLAYERQRDEEAKREWDAQQAQVAKEWAAQEEDRAYNRNLQDAREARMAPYRAASQAALGKLGGLLGIDFQNGSAPAAAMPSNGAPSGASGPVAPNAGMGLSSPMQAGPMPGAQPTDPSYAQVNPPATLGALLRLPKPAFDPRDYLAQQG